MPRFIHFFAASILLILVLTGCGAQTPSNNSTAMKKETFAQTAPPVTGEKIAILETSKGIIKMKFFPQYAPETVKNFIELAKKGYYEGIIFHRVIPDFMIQGGDPTGTGTGGESYKGPGTTIPAEFSSQLKHIYGAVSMARKGNDINSASSQFFIVQNKKGYPPLNDQYTVFGQVFEGFEVVDAIATTPRFIDDRPKEDVTIKKVTIEEVR